MCVCVREREHIVYGFVHACVYRISVMVVCMYMCVCMCVIRGGWRILRRGVSSYCARKARNIFIDHAYFCVGHAPSRSRLQLNRAAARKMTKEPVSFLIVVIINKAKTPKIV